jgi:hypothetical protein
MLKHVYLNNKKLPVPVPIKTLSEAIKWAEEALLTADRIITKVVLDGTQLEGLEEGVQTPVVLTPESKLCLQVDSAKDLSLQTIDVLRNLASVLERNLKPVAVSLWQCAEGTPPEGLKLLMDDVDLSQALLDHLLGILDRPGDGRIEALALKLGKTRDQMAHHLQSADWKNLARVMLNQYEPELLLLSAELAALQRHLFDTRARKG